MKKTNLFLGALMCLSVQFSNAQQVKVGVAGTVDNDSDGIVNVYNDDFLYDGQYINHYGFGFHNFGASQTRNAYVSGFFGIDFFANGQNRVRINRNGNVGIGTSSPDSKLHINGKLTISGTSNGFEFLKFDSARPWVFKNSGTGSGSTLQLESQVDQKWFEITSKNNGNPTKIARFFTKDNPDYQKVILVEDGGKVGIGTNPLRTLHVKGTNIPLLEGVSNSEQKFFSFTRTDDTQEAYLSYTGADIAIGTGGNSSGGIERLRIKLNGNVGIGTTSPDSPLTVNGKIHATEVLVDTNIFADYVFKNDYELKSLEQVEDYIATKGHLEGFKSEKEIVKEGLNLKETTIKQQEKIEELTLYLIELSKEVKRLKAQLNKE